MPVIHLQTLINAPVERVFDLARSIDAHQDTATGTAERAVDGVTSGLLGPGEDVTWEARHFGVRQRLRVRLTQFDRPTHFQDVMVEGAFQQMTHDHSFTSQHGRTLMIDRFDFNAPLGFLGTIAEWLFLTGHLRRFLETRNAILKKTAESAEWRKYLPPG
jgi:ligand-binding SRPBCC domain-containing protein